MKVGMQKWSARTAIIGVMLGALGGAAEAAVRIEGKVEIGGGAVAGSTVSLWAASADAPARLAQVKTDADGGFVVSVGDAERRVEPLSRRQRRHAGGQQGRRRQQGDRPPGGARERPAAQSRGQRTDHGRVGVHQRPVHQGRVDLRQSARTEDRRRQCAEPRRSRDRRMGQGAARSAQQHAEHDAREPGHARLAHHRVRAGEQR